MESPQTPRRRASDEDHTRIKIRNALQIVGSTRRPIIEIELYSDRSFDGGNEFHVLHVGRKKFIRLRHVDSKGHILIFELMPEEFAKLRDGEEVKVTYRPEVPPRRDIGARRSWRFGKLDKSKLEQ